jgi:hypothetical protein
MEEYVQAAMRRAVYEVDSDGSAFGSVAVAPDLVVNASAPSQRQCIRALHHNVRHAVESALTASAPLPTLDGIAPPRPMSQAA